MDRRFTSQFISIDSLGYCNGHKRDCCKARTAFQCQYLPKVNKTTLKMY